MCLSPRSSLEGFDILTDTEQSDGAGRLQFNGGFRLYGALCASSEHVDRVWPVSPKPRTHGLPFTQMDIRSFLWPVDFAGADSFYACKIVSESPTAALLCMPTFERFIMCMTDQRLS